MSLLESLPQQLGRYRILGRLGHGAMGTVYEAVDSQLERRVAVKVPRFSPQDERAGGLLDRFRREAKAAATLRHPNICAVHDVGEADGQPYLVMAYIEGRPLIDLLPGSRPLPTDQAVAIVVKLADAMQEAHDKGVIHRDLKPANILLDRRDEPVIVDFGVARLSDTVNSTNPGEILGTPLYMAPEQLAGDKVDRRCDVYSLGVILYELLAGQLPFPGQFEELRVCKLTRELEPLSTYRPDLDRRLVAACAKAVARRADGRFSSMADFAAALRRLLSAPAPAAARRGASPWPWLMAGDGAGLVLLGAVLLAWPGLLSDGALAPLLPGAALLVPAALCWAVFGRRAPAPAGPSREAPPRPPTTAPGLPAPPPASPDLEAKLRAEQVAREKGEAELRAQGDARKKLDRELTDLKGKLARVVDWLKGTTLSRTFYQPVLLVGPRGVGKTSLVRQWEAPWDHAETPGTTGHRVCEVAVHKFPERKRVPHNAFPEVRVPAVTNLGLRVHDFPGESDMQRAILGTVRDETLKFRKGNKKNLGVVIVCMFDAEEAHTGLRPDTNRYYTGELFGDLRRLVAKDSVRLERLILVFNKCDLLRSHLGADVPDRVLLDACRKGFATTCEPLRGIVHPERVCEVLTVLGRGELIYKSQGAKARKETRKALVDAEDAEVRARAAERKADRAEKIAAAEKGRAAQAGATAASAGDLAKRAREDAAAAVTRAQAAETKADLAEKKAARAEALAKGARTAADAAAGKARAAEAGAARAEEEARKAGTSAATALAKAEAAEKKAATAEARANQAQERAATAVARAEAWPLVHNLFTRLVRKEAAINELKDSGRQPMLSDAVRKEALALVEGHRQDPILLRRASWVVVRSPGEEAEEYAHALLEAEEACRLALAPDKGPCLTTLGVALCRVGAYPKAVEKLKEAEKLNAAETLYHLADLAFLAMAHHKLEQGEKAADYLGRLRKALKDTRWAGNVAARALLHEAEALLPPPAEPKKEEKPRS